MKYHFSAPGIAASFQKYPLAQKAYERTSAEHCATFFMFHGDEAGVEGEHITQIIDETIDGTQEEKEALMIAAMYMTAPDAMLEDGADIGTLYGDVAAIVLADLQAYQKDAVAPTSIARISTVLNVIIFDALLSDGPIMALPQEAKQELKEAEKLLLPNLNAPKLEKLYRSFSDRLFQPQAGKKQTPKTPRKKGPTV